MMRLIVFTLFLTLSNLFGQTNYIKYYNFVNEGEFHMYEGNYELAINNFEMAFELVEQPKARDYYLTSKCYAQLNNEQLMYQFLEKAMSIGLDKKFVISDSLWFTHFSNSVEFKELLKTVRLKTIHEVDKSSENALNTIDKMFELDILIAYHQAARNKDSLPEVYEIKRQNYIAYRDSMQKKLINYYLNFSMPTTKPLQSQLKHLTLFLMDKSVEEMDQIIDILIENIDKGILYPYYVASLVDFMVPDGLKPFEYSNQEYGISESSIFQEDFNRILNNRKSIGLSTYFYDAPSYSKNYKPTAIIKVIRPIKTKIIEPK